MRAWLIVIMVLMAGCTTSSSVFVGGARVREGDIHFPPLLINTSAASEPGVSLPTRDLNGPNVSLDGLPTLAMPVLIRETMRSGYRHACGGAVMAVAVGAPDPRPRSSSLHYEDSRTLIDDAGASWITDHYVDLALDGPGSDVWVQNVGGNRGWSRDDGSSDCEPARDASGSHNIIMLVTGIDIAEVYFSADARPAEPSS